MLGVLLAAAAVSAPHVVAHAPHPVYAFSQDRSRFAWLDSDGRHVETVVGATDGAWRQRVATPEWWWGGVTVVRGRVLGFRSHPSLGQPYSCVVAADRTLRSQHELTTRPEADCLGSFHGVLASDGESAVFVDPETSELDRYDGVLRSLRRHFAANALAVGGPYVAAQASGHPGELSDADVSPTGDTFVAVSNADAFAGYELDIRSLDGRLVREIDRNALVLWPRWAPDGMRLLWSEGDNAKLMVANADGSGARPVPGAGEAWNPVWSPDGRTIAYIDSRGAAFTIPATGGSPTRVATPAPVNTVAWSPAGALTIATPSGVWVGSNRLVARGASDVAWSPTGDQLAYTSSGVHVVRSDGTDDRALTDPTDLDIHTAPTWSRDGETVLFTRSLYREFIDRDNQVDEALISRSIWAVPAAGGDMHLVADAPAPATVGVFSSVSGRQVLAMHDVAQLTAVSARFVATAFERSVVTHALPNGPPLKHFSFTHRVNALAASGGRLIVGAGHYIWLVDPRSGARRLLAKVQGRFAPIGLSIVGNRVAWAENRPHGAVILSLLLH